MENSEFQRRIKNGKKPIVVDLWAPWCAPCRAMQPAVEQVGKEFYRKVEVLKINADDSPEILSGLGVMSIPTLVAFSGGKEIMRRTGMQSADALKILFDAADSGQKPAVIPPAPKDRFLRSMAGIAVVVVAWFMGKSIPLFVLGGILFFSAFYDRCPIYRALAPKVKALFNKNGGQTSRS
jgi:thioredoxin 1